MTNITSSGIPGVAYNFNNKSLISFEDNFIYKGDLSLVDYMDFETTAPTDNCFNPEQKKMFVVSYVIVDRVIIERNFEHSLKKINDYWLFNKRSGGVYRRNIS